MPLLTCFCLAPECADFTHQLSWFFNMVIGRLHPLQILKHWSEDMLICKTQKKAYFYTVSVFQKLPFLKKNVFKCRVRDTPWFLINISVITSYVKHWRLQEPQSSIYTVVVEISHYNCNTTVKQTFKSCTLWKHHFKGPMFTIGFFFFLSPEVHLNISNLQFNIKFFLVTSQVKWGTAHPHVKLD